jgi:glycosyltransferase involved in cell wall biosynthesis
LKRQVRSDSSVHLTGSVPEVLPYLARSTVSVAPLLTARGIQNKVLEALAAGLPVVTTSNVIEGLPRAVRSGCVCADDTRSIANALIELLRQNPASLRERASSADLSCLSWEQQLRPLLAGLQMASGRNEDAVA